MRLLFLLLALLVIVACSDDSDDPESSPTPAPLPEIVFDHSANPFKIVVSLPIFADMVREIVGDQAQVTTLIPPGANPQTYAPGDDMIAAVAEANIMFYNGNGLEPPTEQFMETHKGYPVMLINFTHNIPSPSTQQPLDRPIYAEQVGDEPHLYLDLRLGDIYPETIADTMVIRDEDNTAYYNARYAVYKEKLRAVDDEITRRMNPLPELNKPLLVSHNDSLIHFARKYGLGVVGTLVGDGQDGLAQVIAAQHPPAVFTETGYDSAALQQLAQTADIQVCNLETDSTADAGTTFIQMMERNADEIARCLGASS